MKIINYTIPEDHPDLKRLIYYLDLCLLNNKIDKFYSSSIDKDDNKFEYSGNTLRTIYVYDWNNYERNLLRKKFDKINKKTSEYIFELISFNDRVEFDNKAWPASFNFISKKK
jgi:hypothetical protein